MMQTNTAHCWLAIRFLHLPLESLGIPYKDAGSIVVNNNGYVCDYTHTIHLSTIKIGSRVSSAHILSDIKDVIFDSEKVSQKLNQAISYCYQYTPYIEKKEIQHPHGEYYFGIFLEVSKSLTLFGGLENLYSKLCNISNVLNLTCSIGIAHNKHAAWLLSHPTEKNTNISNINLCNNEKLNYDEVFCINRIAKLPLTYFNDFYNDTTLLSKMGFIDFFDIENQIRKHGLASLKKRINHELCDIFEDIYSSLTQASQKGLFSNSKKTHIPTQNFKNEIQMEYPVTNCDFFQKPIEQLLKKLTNFLIKKQAQTSVIIWNFYDFKNSRLSIPINTETLHANYSLAFELTKIKLENVELPFEVDRIELICNQFFNREHANTEINFNQARLSASSQFKIASSKVSTRLGEKNVYRIHIEDSHIPEHAISKKQTTATQDYHENEGPRPSWIFSPPQKIKYTKGRLFWRGKLSVIFGPERIESEWWNTPVTRDYFIAMRDDHSRLWIFHDRRTNAWYAHGIFS